MTVCFPPLIKPDRRFSRIRLSEFLASQPQSRDQLGFATRERVWALVALTGRHHVLRCASLLRNKWRPFAPPRVVRTRGPARDHRYHEHLRLLSRTRAAFPFDGVVSPVESLLAMTDLPAYPSVTSRHVAHADPAGPLSDPRRFSGSDSSAFAQT